MRQFTTRSVVVLICVGILVATVPALGLGQGTTQKTTQDSKKIIDRLLTFIQTIAETIGNWLVELIKQFTGVYLKDLAVPIGYLGVLTLALTAFGALDAARKIVWLIVLLGWGLLILRIVIEILEKTPSTGVS